MKFNYCALVLSQAILALSKPLPQVDEFDLILEARSVSDLKAAGGAAQGATPPAAPPAAPAEGGGEGAEQEVEQAGQFDVPIVLTGGAAKIDTLYPPGVNGVFEIEFQNADSRTLTVTQNLNPAAPPPGFVSVEPVSFIVNLAEGAEGVTLQKVDYILNKGNTLDISKGSIGRFCAEAGAFVIDPALGEQEFEADENELLIKTKNMNGEWGIFVPVAAPAAPAPAPANPGAAPAPDAAAPGAAPSATMQEFIQLLLSMLGPGAAPLPQNP